MRPTTQSSLQPVGAALAATFEAAAAKADGRIRVEDLLSAAAAVCGEACVAAAGEVDPEKHTFVPGSAVLSDRVNQILCADAKDWDTAGQSVFGIIREGAVTHGYTPADFPPITDPIRLYVESLGSGTGDAEARWGQVALSVPEANRPGVQPLRQAFELRSAVRKVLTDGHVLLADWPSACAVALVIELARVRRAIDPGVAVRIVLETVNGMAKMAPMTASAFREASGG